jgi:hypothetical protein
MEPEVRERVQAEFEERLASSHRSGAESARQEVDSRLEKLDTALKEISLQNNQVDILTAYLDKAAIFAPRTALFVIKSGNLVGWQARGFEGEFNNASIKTVMFSADRENFLRKAADTRTTMQASTSGNPNVLEVVSKFGALAPDTVYAVPLVVRDKTVAVLYADSGTTPNGLVDAHSLEIITTVVSLTVELSSARAKLGIKPAEAPAASKETAAAPPVQAAPPLVPHVTTPISERREEAAPPPATPPHARELPKPPAQSAQRVEAPPAAPIPGEMAPPTPSLTELDEGEQKLHSDAKRFARLLISEIKLYNEQKVQAGRRDKNLYSLLRDDIDKSREMYEKRVSPSVAAKVDYFYDELVRILADNQVAALGADCPGPALLAS